MSSHFYLLFFKNFLRWRWTYSFGATFGAIFLRGAVASWCLILLWCLPCWAGKRLTVKQQSQARYCSDELNTQSGEESIGTARSKNSGPLTRHARRPYVAVGRDRKSWAENSVQSDKEISQIPLEELFINFTKKAFNLRTFQQSPLWSKLIQDFVSFLISIARSQSLDSLDFNKDPVQVAFLEAILDSMTIEGSDQSKLIALQEFVHVFTGELPDQWTERQVLSRMKRIFSAKDELLINTRMMSLLGTWVVVKRYHSLNEGQAWFDQGAIVDKNLKLMILITRPLAN